jgi:hypothetical protein
MSACDTKRTCGDRARMSGFEGKAQHMLAVRISAFDPKETLARQRKGRPKRVCEPLTAAAPRSPVRAFILRTAKPYLMSYSGKPARNRASR